MYNRSRVFAAACAGLFLFGVTLITLGSILPALGERFLSSGLKPGILTAILPIGILAGSLVFGPIVDRYGYKLLLIISVLISAIALEGVALIQSPYILCVCIFFIGFGGGIINGGTSALVSDISPENKGASLSLLGVFFGIGAFGLPLLLGVLSDHFAYDSIIAVVAALMIVPLIYFFFVKFPDPKQSQGFPLKEGIKLIREPALLLTGFFLFFQSGVEALINNWTTSFLQQKLKTTPEDALYALSFSVVGLTIARILLGTVFKKTNSVLIMNVSLLLVAMGCLALMVTNSYPLAFAALIVIGAGLGAGFPVILGYVGQLYAHFSGTAFSIALVIALSGNTLLNYLFGLIAGKSISQLPVMVIGCVLCMLVILAVLIHKIKGKVKL